MAGPLSTGLGIHRRKQDHAPIEIEILELNPNELSDPATQLVDHPKDQFVAVILNGIEEFL
jgi:hypothetical protein